MYHEKEEEKVRLFDSSIHICHTSKTGPKNHGSIFQCFHIAGHNTELIQNTSIYSTEKATGFYVIESVCTIQSEVGEVTSSGKYFISIT